MSKICITCGDTDFQKTLTENELKYIREGQNWISKFSRETDLKALHSIGWTLDEVVMLDKETQDALWRDATDCWNNQNWRNAKFLKNNAKPIEPSDIVMTKK